MSAPETLRCMHIHQNFLDQVAELVAIPLESFPLADDVPRRLQLCPLCFGLAHGFMLQLGGRLPGRTT